MINLLLEISPINAAGNLQTIRLASRGVGPSGTTLNGYAWLPLITKKPARTVEWAQEGVLSETVVTYDDLEFEMTGEIGVENEHWSTWQWQGAYCRMWVGNEGADWSSYTQIYEGSAGAIAREGMTASLPLLSMDHLVDRNLLIRTYAGTDTAGGPEGQAALRGTLKPFCAGSCANVEPIKVDPVAMIYQYHGYGPTNSISAVYENALSLGPPAATATTWAALSALTLADGTWAAAPAIGAFRLANNPTGRITADVSGALDGAAFPKTIGAVMALIIKTTGLSTDRVAPSLASRTESWRIYQTEQVTVADLLRPALIASGCASVPTNDGKYAAMDYYTLAPALTLNGNNDNLPIVRSYRQLNVAPPIWQVIVSGDRNFTEMGAADISQAIGNISLENEARDEALAEARDVADQAQASATVQAQRIADILSDGILDRGEKADQNGRYESESAQKVVLMNKATEFDVTTQRASFNAAFGNLSLYLNSLTPSFFDLSVDTPAVRDTYDSYWKAYEVAKMDLTNAMTGDASRKSTWAGVSGDGRPADNATVGAPVGTNVGGVPAETVVSNAAAALAAVTKSGVVIKSADLLQGIANLQTTYGDTESSKANRDAAEAAASASNVSKVNAETAFNNAVSARDAAQSALALATTAKTGAETAFSNANTAKVAAQAAQTASETAKGLSQAAQTAAQTAKSNAETAASNATGQASTASTQAGLAVGANSAANATAAAMFPDRLDGSVLAWTGTRSGQSPSPFPTTSYTAVPGYGKALTFNTTDSAQFGVNHLVAVPFVQGRFYRLEIEYAVTSAAAGLNPTSQFVITPMDANYALLSTGQIFGGNTVVGADPVTRIVTLGCGVAGGDVNIPSTASWIRTEFKFYNNSANTGVISWQVRRYKVSDVTTQIVTGQVASAASVSASNASASATTSEQKSTISTTQASIATTKAGDALTYSNNALQSSNSALGSAQTATQQAGIATTAKGLANDAAIAAAGSASSADTNASKAGNSASAAATSAVSARSSYDAANQSVAASFPSDFSQGSKFWTNATLGQFPADTTVGAYVQAAGAGQVYQVSDENAIVSPKGYFKSIFGRRYRFTAVVRSVTDPTSGPTGFGVDFLPGLGAMFNQAPQFNGTHETTPGLQNTIAIPASAGWVTIAVDFIPSDPPNPFTRPRLFSFATNPAGHVWQVRSMTFEDVTAITAAGAAATSASVSASKATTKADAASQSADAASTSANTASTKAGDALTYSGNAARSASDALGSMQTATTQAGVATTAKTAAETARDLAQGSAGAASISASTATSKADAAGLSASGALTQATNAQTHAGNAQTYRDQASTSAGNALTSANTATTQAGVSARSALDAAGAAIDGNKVPGASPSTWSINEYNVFKPTGRLPATDTGGISYVAGQLRINGGGHIHPVAVTRLIAGRRYVASVTFRLISNGTQDNGHNLFVDFFDLNGVGVADSSVAVLATTTVAAGFKTLTATVSSNSAGGSIGWPSNAVFGRVMFRTAGGVTTEITSLFLEDTEAKLAAAESATASAGSASTANTKAGEAGQSASAAQGSATLAGTKAGEASTSASNASTSESNALGSKNAAASSASVAATAKDDAVTAKGLAQGSATAAATSASQASTSKDTAGQSASAAQGSASIASTKAGDAQTYASNAATSASNALGSQQTATTQAGLAAGSKTDAGLSASAAAGSASTASTKAGEAGGSASAAAASSLSATGFANAASALATGNLVRQPTFESLSNVDWRGSSLATVESATGIPSGRTSLLRLTSRDVWQTQVINGAWRGRKIKVTVEAWNGSTFPLNVGFQLLRPNNTADYALYQVWAANTSTWGTKTIEFTVPDIDYVWARPILQLANDGGGGVLNAAVSYVRMEDVTAVKAAESSAVLAAGSASTASSKADAATGSASTATTAASNAATYRDNASTYAGQALTSANNASSSAASASLASTISSSFSAVGNVKNNKFANWSDPAAYPAFWQAFSTGGNYRINRATGIGSPYSIATLNDNPNVESGFVQVGIPVNNGAYVMEVTARLDGGDWNGSGITVAGRWNISFATDPDTSGVTTTVGTGVTRSWSKYFVINGEENTVNVHGFVGWSGFGTVTSAKYMTWYNVSFRSASDSERKAEVALPLATAASSAITTLQSTTASQGSSLATVINTVAAQATGGGNILPNTSFPVGANGTTGWAMNWSLSSPPANYGVNIAGDAWHPEGENTLTVMHNGRSNGGFSEWDSNRFPVSAGSYIQFSVLAASHRTDTQLYIFWYNSAGTNIGNTGDYMVTNGSTRRTGGVDINNWTRLGLPSYQVPAGAVSAQMGLRTQDTDPGNVNPNNSYSWFLRPYVGAAKAGQTDWNPYSPGSGSLVQTALQASVTTMSSAVADAAGKLQAYLVSDVSAGNGRAILSLRANGVTGSSNIDLAASQIRLINSAGGILSPTLSVQDGNVSISGDLYMGTGRIVSKNGAYMKVQGSGFGSNNQFLEWYGPVKSTLDQCTESIAITYLRVDGQAYFGGRVAEGDLRTVKTTYDGGLSQVANGPIVTNGKTRVWTAGLSVRRTGIRNSNYAPQGSWTGTFVIEKLVNNNWVQQGAAGSLTGYTYQSGNNGIATEFEPANFSQEASGSQSFSDTSGGIDPYNIRARITSISLPGVSGTAYTADYTVQMLTINTYEV